MFIDPKSRIIYTQISPRWFQSLYLRRNHFEYIFIICTQNSNVKAYKVVIKNTTFENLILQNVLIEFKITIFFEKINSRNVLLGFIHKQYRLKCVKLLFIVQKRLFYLSKYYTTFGFSNEKKIYSSTLYEFITADLTHTGKRGYLDFIPACQNRNAAARLHQIAEAMMQTLLFPSFGASYQLCGQLCSFMSDLSAPDEYHCTALCLDTNSDFLLFSRITRLFEESDGRMTRTELEQLLHYSGDYLNRIVNKFTDMCLYDYGLTFCMKKAAHYLTETSESISAIAAKLRFSNRTHFYALFKEKYGVTPKQYRQMHSSLGAAFTTMPPDSQPESPRQEQRAPRPSPGSK